MTTYDVGFSSNLCNTNCFLLSVFSNVLNKVKKPFRPLTDYDTTVTTVCSWVCFYVFLNFCFTDIPRNTPMSSGTRVRHNIRTGLFWNFPWLVSGGGLNIETFSYVTSDCPKNYRSHRPLIYGVVCVSENRFPSFVCPSSVNFFRAWLVMD